MLAGWLQDFTAVGADPTGASDSTAAVNAAFAVGSGFFPPGNYVLSGDVLIPSNRHILVMNGAIIINTGGRFTAHVPGGGNIHLEIDGTIGFLDTKTAPQMQDWPTSAQWGDERGLIEIGGSFQAPASNIIVDGTGRVYSDYVWNGVPASVTNPHFQINRKGIAIWNAYRCLVSGLEVDHIYGEAVYFNGYANNFDIRFQNNYVHDCAFNGLNFNVSQPYRGLYMNRNTVLRTMQGIEASGGTVEGNYIDTCNIGITFGAGAGILPSVLSNQVVSASNIGYSLQFAQLVQNINIIGNKAISCGGPSYIVTNVQDFQFKNNSSYYHANAKPAPAYNITNTTSGGHLDGNITSTSGAHSTGGFVNSGANVVGTNPVF